jgi:hypothetical protein
MNEEQFKQVPEDFSLQQVRPRFVADIALKPSEIVKNFNAALAQTNAPCKGEAAEHYATLYFPKNKQKYWTPILTLTISETELGSHIRGMYSPQPSIWTMFVFFYTVIGTLGVFALIIGGAQSTVGKNPWALWLSIPLFAILASLFFVAQYGKKKSRPQMSVIHDFLIQQVLKES